MMRGGTLLILGHQVNVNYDTLYIRPSDDERRNTIDLMSRVKGQGQIRHSV